MDSNSLVKILERSLPKGLLGLIALLIIYIVHNWERIKPFVRDVKTSFLNIHGYIRLKKINSRIDGAFSACRNSEPIFRVFRNIIPVQLKINSKIDRPKLELREGKALALIPSRSMQHVVDAIHSHFEKHMSHLSVVRDFRKLERTLELACLDLVIHNCKMDGALAIATNRFRNTMMEDNEIRLMFCAMSDLNNELKKSETVLDRRFLRILITESCRSELSAIGKVLT